MEMEEQRTRYLVTYTADSADPFWPCGVKGCQLSYPHDGRKKRLLRRRIDEIARRLSNSISSPN